jgi:RNA polymerase-associated protein
MAVLANRRSIMTFYSEATGAASHAVRFVLAEKAINVDVLVVQGDEPPEELHDLNPYHGVLTLVDRDLVLYEEHIIMEYLDERFPHPPLMPVDPVSRANNRLLRYRIKRDIGALMESTDPTATGSAVKEMRKVVRDHMTAIAPAFVHKPYCMSDEFSLVDCYLTPLLWRLPYFGIELPSQARPLLQYARRMFERESFKRSLTEAERELR